MSDLVSISQEVLLEYEAKRSKLAGESLDLCDDFGKFSEECAFLFDAFAAVAREPECITPDTIEGIRHINFWLKYQVIGYREKIDNIHAGLRALKLKPQE
ncbi:hypothetical protein [Thalassomonas actiniarum]|uniref:Uncharacterized protein n=1 Tax=Thalassomonas actiniarum TaxID=485447 RepID=A0AAE9YPM9_9GAMM|nr:hypothetical protein [Thalassomonas actiniarum]WDD98491.1 hypothetical protein SG35_025095 [Thalassomonas actiniarum]